MIRAPLPGFGFAKRWFGLGRVVPADCLHEGSGTSPQWDILLTVRGCDILPQRGAGILPSPESLETIQSLEASEGKSAAEFGKEFEQRSRAIKSPRPIATAGACSQLQSCLPDVILLPYRNGLRENL